MIKNSKEEYLALFKEKKRLFDKEFKNVSSIQYYDSPYENFRYRAEFGLLERHKKQSYAMTVNGQRKIINTFPIVSKKIQELMSSLIELINGNTLISKRLFQVEFQSSRNNEAMITDQSLNGSDKKRGQIPIKANTIKNKIPKPLFVSFFFIGLMVQATIMLLFVVSYPLF